MYLFNINFSLLQNVTKGLYNWRFILNSKMTKRTGGGRRKTRYKLKKNKRDRGKISIRRYLQEFKIGEGVYLKAEPAIQKGMYFRRFHGKHGKIVKKIGRCYEVSIKDFNSKKTLIVHPVHLKRA